MRWWRGAVLVLVSGCSAGHPVCAVVALAGATPHSVEGEVATRMLAGAGSARRVCIQVFRHPSYDLMGDPAAEVALAQRVAAQDDVIVVVGHVSSAGTLAAAPVYQAQGIAELVPAGTSRLLARFHPSLMSLAPDDSVEGAALAAYGDSAFGVRNVLIFYRDDQYGEGLLAGVRAGLAVHGARIAAAVQVLAGSDVTTLVDAALKGTRPDGAFLLGDYRVVGRAAEALHTRRPKLPFLAGDAAAYPRGLAEEAGGAVGEIRVLTPSASAGDSSLMAAYLGVFRGVAGRDPTPDEILTEDALMVAVKAIEEAGPDRAAVESWLASLGGRRPAWRGITGPIQFVHPNAGGFAVSQVRNGALVPAPVTPR